MKRHIVIFILENDIHNPENNLQKTNFVFVCPVHCSAGEEFCMKQVIEKEKNKNRIFEYINEIAKHEIQAENFAKLDLTILKECIDAHSKIVVEFVDGSYFTGNNDNGIDGYFIATKLVMKFMKFPLNLHVN